MRKPNLRDARKRTKEEVKIISDAYIIPDGIESMGKGKKYYLRTYGCQMNLRDSETIRAILEDLGYEKEEDYLKADMVLLNTCAIRENAHNKVFGMLGRFKNLKKQKPNLIIGLCGCMPQEEVVIDEIINKYPWLDFVFGTHNIHALPQILLEYITQKQLTIDVFSNEGNIYENIPVKRDSKYKAWINIMYGCDKFCTYCIVPYTRGKQRSRKKEDIINEIKALVKDNYQEVTLLGQNVNAYGKDKAGNNYYLENLLQDISQTGINRVRFITSHPWDFTDDLIRVIKENKNIMPHLHFPVQSGSNKILKLMGRRYTNEDYINLYKKIKKEIPNMVITTDIIVGFPNETKEDFDKTIDLVNQCQFDGAFTFIYSKREGTPAAKIKDTVTTEEKRNRLRELNKLINKYMLESNKRLVFKTVEVLIEGFSENNKELLMGYTNTFKLVNIKGHKDNIGKIVLVKITEAKTWSLNGEIIDEKEQD